jgi:hypothetical protein
VIIVKAIRITIVPAKGHVQGAAVPSIKELITYLTIEVITIVPKINERTAKIMSTKIRVRFLAGTIPPVFVF